MSILRACPARIGFGTIWRGTPPGGSNVAPSRGGLDLRRARRWEGGRARRGAWGDSGVEGGRGLKQGWSLYTCNAEVLS